MSARASRRDALRTLAMLGLLGAQGIPGLIRSALAAGEVAQGMRKLSGDVRINGRPARQGDVVRPGDTVITGEDAEAIYVVGQNAFLQRAQTTTTHGSSSGSAKTTQKILRVLTGSLLAVFGRGPQTIQSSTATIGIRGTGCYIQNEAERTYFCLCYGGVELIPSGAPQLKQSYATTHHDKPMYIGKHPEDGEITRPAPVMNHSDKELDMLEALVGRVTPFFGKYDYKY